MRAIGVIPARYASQRFPGKPLARIKDKEMILWVLDGARSARSLDDIIVATDDTRIEEVVLRAGGKVIMTESNLPSGSDRIWAATKNTDAEVIVNIQGDEPLIKGILIDKMVDALFKDESLEMATLANPIAEEELKNENVVKVVINKKNEAIYFSRFPIPYSRKAASNQLVCLKHVGMYAYRKSFLKQYCSCDPVEIEKAESLEQLRALYLGGHIKVIEVAEKSFGVDTPEDIQRVEKILGGQL